MIVTIILFIVILGTTVFVHELGHFLFAKMAKVHIYEFALGFGPVLLKKKGKDGTQYAIRAIPLGGFVSMAGEEVNLDKSKHEGRNIQDKSFIQRLLIMFMGVGFNFIFAFLIILIMGFIYGAPSMEPTLTEIAPNSAAYVSGLEAGDKIISINDRKVTYRDDIALFLTLTDKNKDVIFEVEKHDNSIMKYSVKPDKQTIGENTTYVFGIGYGSVESEKGFFNKFKYAFLQECAMFKQMFVVLGSLFTGKLGLNELSGPVGIFNIVGEAKTYGLYAILNLLALLSINVGIINVIPLPAFDGGRILFLIIEKIKGSPINPKVENTIHSIGFILLMALMVYITFNDILKLF